jgi:hypothetical protein
MTKASYSAFTWSYLAKYSDVSEINLVKICEGTMQKEDIKELMKNPEFKEKLSSLADSS